MTVQYKATHVSDRVKRIKPSPGSATTARANELRRQGKSIITLVDGEPNANTDAPPHIRRTASEASIATSLDDLREGADRIARAVAGPK